MYQLKYSCGMEIVVKGDLCKVVNTVVNKIEFCGNYEQCQKWLAGRGCKPIF